MCRDAEHVKVYCELTLSEHLLDGSKLSHVGSTQSQAQIHLIWHVDGNHRFICWRFVVHGCMDGFSRMITFLSFNTNNRAETVFQLFTKVSMEYQYGIPSRVQSDRGGENISKCFMVSYRGPGRRSHIAGSSVHNQRIESLWRDVYRCVFCTFHEVFYFLEAQGVLDPNNEYNLFVLPCVFLPVINHLLQAYARAWNRHPSVQRETGHHIRFG